MKKGYIEANKVQAFWKSCFVVKTMVDFGVLAQVHRDSLQQPIPRFRAFNVFNPCIHIPHKFSDYNQSMNSPEACRRRLMKYVFPVIFLSFLFNIPKFLEARIGYELTGPTNQSRVIEVNHGMYNGSVAVFIDGSYYKLEHGQGVNHTVDQLKELFEVPVVRRSSAPLRQPFRFQSVGSPWITHNLRSQLDFLVSGKGGGSILLWLATLGTSLGSIKWH